MSSRSVAAACDFSPLPYTPCLGSSGNVLPLTHAVMYISVNGPGCRAVGEVGIGMEVVAGVGTL